MIHSTAIVEKGAQLDTGVCVGPYSVVEKKAKIGKNTTIGSHVTVDSCVTIGADCKIYQFAAIGGAPQALKYNNEETFVRIDDNTIVREFVTINRGTAFGTGVTHVGENNYLMAYSHVAHDCKTGKHTIMSNCASLGGHIEMGNYVTLGGLSAIHQFVRIGRYAFVSGMSAVVKDIPPFVLAAGDRARLHGLNVVGLSRAGFAPEVISTLKKAYRIIFRSGLRLNMAITRVREEVAALAEVEELIEFIENSNRGITREKASDF